MHKNPPFHINLKHVKFQGSGNMNTWERSKYRYLVVKVDLTASFHYYSPLGSRRYIFVLKKIGGECKPNFPEKCVTIFPAV